ncbi:MAG: hypothetical protein A2Y12_04330 [Planctomycetes bacterium GWF2_42_9]|nr:MAG: hypothetical protein A2Y12_04330 [Planctomycetes bacterium GWF2_42_9]
MKRFKAFTLVELLVVISIIALLLSILMPSLNKARKAAQKIVCLSNTRTASQATMLYASDNKNKFMNHRGTQWVDWHSYLVPYLSKQQYKTNAELYYAPTTQKDREKYFKPWWDLVCPGTPKSRMPRNNIDVPMIYGIHMGGPFPLGNVVPLYTKGYGIYDWSSGKSRSTLEVTSSGLVFAEILNTDYIWATIVTCDKIPGIEPRLNMDLRDRHPGGNAAAFADGHVESIREKAVRDPQSSFWIVTKRK